MELLGNLALGFSQAFVPANLLCAVLGCFLGLLVGVLPGITPVAAMALLLPVTYALPPAGALILLATVYLGSQHGVLTGHVLAQQGRAGPALVAASVSAAVAGLVAMLLLAAIAPMLSRWSQAFGAPERTALLLLALVGGVILASGKLIKGLAMVALGLLLSLVGTDTASGLTRFTLELPELKDGIGLVVLAIGLLVYGDVFKRLARGKPLRLLAVSVGHGLWPMWFHGNLRGVVVSQAAHSVAARSNFLPMLALGLPSNTAMVLMLGAMSLCHLQPGPLALVEHAPPLWSLVAALGLAGVLLVLLHVPLMALWSRLPRVPYRWLVPVLVLLSTLGVYSLHRSVFDIWLMAGFGVLGYVLHWLDLDAAPLLLGYTLGPAMEENLRAAMQLSEGDWSVFATHPLSAGFLLATVFLLVLVLLPVVQMRREEAFVEGLN